MTGVLQTLIGGFGAAAAAVTDAYFYLVTLLLPGNGTNGAQNNTFLDSSSNNFTITRNGNTTQGTFSPFSQTGWSNYFNGATTSGPLLFTTYSTTNFDWFTSGQDFTLECWVFPVDLATFSYSDSILIISRMTGNNDQNGTTNFWSFGPINDGRVRLHYFNGATVQVTSTSTVTANAWNHIAFTKTSSGITIFVNGTATTATAILGTPQSSTSYPLTIGRGNGGSINGYVSNYRILKNVTPPYSGSYTVPTAPLTDISGTKILTAQANRFVDSSSVANVMSVTGSTVSIQAFSPFAPTAAYSAATVGGSGYFDGSGDYLSVANNTALQLSTSVSWCLEAWIYPTALVNADNGIIGKRITASVEWQFAVKGTGDAAARELYLYNGSGNYFSGTKISGVNAWHHVAVSWDQTTLRFFINGTLCATTHTSISLPAASTNSVGVGANGNVETFTGYITDARIVKGSAVYTASFTPPTAPLTAITNTSLLTNFTNAGITDATAKNVLETVGNAQISTTQSKFGGSSMYFDGTGDYAVVNSSAANSALGSGDWTVEFWLYTNVGSTEMNIIDWRPSGASGNYFALYIKNTGVLAYFVNGADRITSGTAISTATWTHIAVSRSGTSTRMFINGTQTGSTYTDSANYLGAADRPVVGGGGTTTYAHLNGYIDDLRVTRGYARYTSNFTAPTAAFPLQ